MNGFGARERSWRKGKKRAVSPIIATILLVAITVVLAAVLYILISGLTKGPGNTPLGTAFGFGTPTQETGATSGGPTGCTASASEICYSIPIGEASGGLTANELSFQVKSPSGQIGALTSVSVLNLNGDIVGFYTSGAWSSAACAGTTALPTAACGGTTTLSSTQTLVVDFGTTSVTGDSFIALGQGSFSGQVSTVIP